MRRRLPPRGPGRRARAAPAGLTLVLLLTGCGESVDEGSAPTSAAPPSVTPGGSATTSPPTSTGAGMTEHGAGDVLTPADTGSTLRLSPGEEATLRLEPPLQEVAPTAADPGVVELVPVDHLVDPGYAEYQLLAHAAGTTTVTVAGTDDHPEDMVLEVVVDGG
ncbi:pilus assembly protein N-terminal domain-containing protein [Ornithinimicrobium cerasi]|uniref:pilus assembly protein N-terminal domain-containing protein n=1 Tax=Ornithinimicrobium cerasi TaxID=2248773 RepID=UPI00137B76E9|nr:pilus assembly protein N-terminal domain-containing protein [Ornithinimicrobium cerasi]